MVAMAPGKHISLREATFDILLIEHPRYKVVLYYISQWEKHPENIKSQVRTVHEGQQHKHSQGARFP